MSFGSYILDDMGIPTQILVIKTTKISTTFQRINRNVSKEKNLIYKMFYRKPEEVKHTANMLCSILAQKGINAEVITSKGYCGGGTLPESEIESHAVMLKHSGTRKECEVFAEKMYFGLLQHDMPVLGILKKGLLCFDVLTLLENEVEEVGNIIENVFRALK